jgi:hypothetical protein
VLTCLCRADATNDKLEGVLATLPKINASKAAASSSTDTSNMRAASKWREVFQSGISSQQKVASNEPVTTPSKLKLLKHTPNEKASYVFGLLANIIRNRKNFGLERELCLCLLSQHLEGSGVTKQQQPGNYHLPSIRVRAISRRQRATGCC